MPSAQSATPAPATASPPASDTSLSGTSTPVAAAAPHWRHHRRPHGHHDPDHVVATLDGGLYQAEITLGQQTRVDYRWTILEPGGERRAAGTGTVGNLQDAKAAVEIDLDVQQHLGHLPSDLELPAGSIPTTTSATTDAELALAITTMRARIADARKVNPITGQPDPLQPFHPAGHVPEPPLFDAAEAVRAHLAAAPNSARQHRGGNNVGRVRWDSATLTTGGTFAVIDDLLGTPHVLHTQSGAFCEPPVNGKLNRTDMLRWASIVESLPGRDRVVPGWSPTDSQRSRGDHTASFPSDATDESSQLGGLALDILFADKIRAGEATHPLIVNDLRNRVALTNPARNALINELHGRIRSILKAVPGRMSAFDRSTLDHALAADTIAAMGAPDVGVALLNRRANQIREHHGDHAPAHAAELLDRLAQAILAAYSPLRSPGDRVAIICAGERILFTTPGAETVRTFRVLAPLQPTPEPARMITSAVDERTGQHVTLSVDDGTVMITHDAAAGWTDAVVRAFRHTSDFLVVGSGEAIPQTAQELTEHADNDSRAVPADVLAAAATALPAAAARRTTPKASRPRTIAPITWSTAQPVRNEEQLDSAQQRIRSGWIGMPISKAATAITAGFSSLADVREKLLTITPDNNRRGQHGATCATAAIDLIDTAQATLSTAGAFLVSTSGTVLDARTGLTIWPPAGDHTNPVRADLLRGGSRTSHRAAIIVADLLEHGVFDGEQLDWRGDDATAQMQAIAERTAGGDLLRAVHRYAYLELVHGAKKPTATELAMLRGLVCSAIGVQHLPNPEALLGRHAPTTARDYEALINDISPSTYAADTRAAATLAAHIAREATIAAAVARVAPLDAVRRLHHIANDLDGKHITGIRRYEHHNLPPTKTYTPSHDLRTIAEAITDGYDESKLSASARLRRADMVGRISPTSAMRVRVGSNWDKLKGDETAAAELENLIREAGGLTFIRDRHNRLHVTYPGVDIVADVAAPRTTERSGTITLSPDGAIAIDYWEPADGDRRRIEIKLPSGDWELEPPLSPPAT